MIRINIKNINNEFKSLKEKQEKELKKFGREQSNKLISELRAVTPVDTGLARNSWSSSETKDGFDIRNSTEYIQYLNEGTSKQAPARFIEFTALKYGKPLGTIVQVYDE